MSKKPVSYKLSDVSGPPQKEDGKPGWIWFTCDLLTSPSWRARSLYCARFIDFLIVENLLHDGYDNGILKATYKQLQEAGIPRGCIPPAIAEAEALRLIEVRRGGKRNLVEDHLSLYRLTFCASREIGPDGKVYYAAPTNEWKRVTQDRVVKIGADMKARRRQGKRGKDSLKNSVSVPHGGTVSVPHGGTVSVPHGGTEG